MWGRKSCTKLFFFSSISLICGLQLRREFCISFFLSTQSLRFRSLLVSRQQLVYNRADLRKGRKLFLLGWRWRLIWFLLFCFGILCGIDLVIIIFSQIIYFLFQSLLHALRLRSHLIVGILKVLFIQINLESIRLASEVVAANYGRMWLQDRWGGIEWLLANDRWDLLVVRLMSVRELDASAEDMVCLV